MTVYLLHFNPPYKHARHYMGFVDGGDAQLSRRIDQHRKGAGARLCAVAFAAGCKIELARVWPGLDRKAERKLKRQRCAPKMCPICRQEGDDNARTEVQAEGR